MEKTEPKPLAVLIQSAFLLNFLFFFFLQTTTGRAGLGGHEAPVQVEVRDAAVPPRGQTHQPPPGSGTTGSHRQPPAPAKGSGEGASSFAHGQQGDRGDGEMAAGRKRGERGERAKGVH